jgi:hypothetical protein
MSAPLTSEQKDSILAATGIDLRWKMGPNINAPYTAYIKTDEFEISIQDDVIIYWKRVLVSDFDYTTLL